VALQGTCISHGIKAPCRVDNGDVNILVEKVKPVKISGIDTEDAFLPVEQRTIL